MDGSEVGAPEFVSYLVEKVRVSRVAGEPQAPPADIHDGPCCGGRGRGAGVNVTWLSRTFRSMIVIATKVEYSPWCLPVVCVPCCQQTISWMLSGSNHASPIQPARRARTNEAGVQSAGSGPGKRSDPDRFHKFLS